MLLFLLVCFTAQIHASYPLTIAVYNGSGTGDFNGFLCETLAKGAEELVGEGNYIVMNITAQNVKKLTSNAGSWPYDVIVFPGGSGSGQAKAIGVQGISNLRKFVKSGGGFIGTCGGAYLAMTWLEFYGPDIHYQTPVDRGNGPVQVDFTQDGIENLNLDYEMNQNVTIQYYDGPVVKEDVFPDDVQIFAHYRSEINTVDPEHTTGMMINTPAIHGREVEKGRVALNSPHPELVPNYPDIYGGELRWVLQ